MTSTIISAHPPPAAEALPKPRPAVSTTEEHTYGHILKSTALIGASSAVTIVAGIVRTKANALFLGPEGVGLMGLYGSVLDLAQSLAGMGLQSSGVRQIAEASGSGELPRIARTVLALRQASIWLGVIGAGMLLMWAGPIARLTFGSDQRSAAIMFLSVAVFFRLLTAGQGALLQGMRRISDMARIGVIAALLTTLTSVLIVYFFRENGIVPSIIAVSVISTLVTWRYSRRVRVNAVAMSSSQVLNEVTLLLRVGFSFMASGFLVMGAAYAVRLIVLRKIRRRSRRTVSIVLDARRSIRGIHSASHGCGLLSTPQLPLPETTLSATDW